MTKPNYDGPTTRREKPKFWQICGTNWGGKDLVGSSLFFGCGEDM